MGGFKFTKIVTEDVGTETDKPTPSPTVTHPETGDSIPTFVEEVKETRRKKREGKDSTHAVPLDISPTASDGQMDTGHKSRGGKSKGKKSGSKQETETVLSASIIGKQVFGFHQILNVMFPGTAIEPGQADAMGEAIADVMEAFEFKVSKKVSALMALGATVAIVEFPVAMTIKKQLKEKSVSEKAVKQASQETKPGQVAVGKPDDIETRVQRPTLVVNSGGVAVGEPFKG